MFEENYQMCICKKRITKGEANRLLIKFGSGTVLVIWGM